jgi:hypothetical protein
MRNARAIVLSRRAKFVAAALAAAGIATVAERPIRAADGGSEGDGGPDASSDGSAQAAPAPCLCAVSWIGRRTKRNE